MILRGILFHALIDETKFDIKGMDTACGIWAPNLTYDNATFYLIYTMVYTNRHRFKDTHNFMVTASDPKGPWSDPIPLNKEITQGEKVYLEENGKTVYLKAEVRECDVTFFVSQDGISYTQVGDVLDMRNLSDERVDGNGFTGAMVGVSCQDLHGDGVQADFDWLDYKVFKPL